MLAQAPLATPDLHSLPRISRAETAILSPFMHVSAPELTHTHHG